MISFAPRDGLSACDVCRWCERNVQSLGTFGLRHRLADPKPDIVAARVVRDEDGARAICLVRRHRNYDALPLAIEARKRTKSTHRQGLVGHDGPL